MSFYKIHKLLVTISVPSDLATAQTNKIYVNDYSLYVMSIWLYISLSKKEVIYQHKGLLHRIKNL